MEDRKTELDVMAVKSFLHTSMQALFGICNAAHHIDILRFENSPGKTIVLLRIVSEGYKLLLQTLPTISLYQEKRCSVKLLDASPLLTQIQ
jgi:RNase P/RNase MRP subunit POP5